MLQVVIRKKGSQDGAKLGSSGAKTIISLLPHKRRTEIGEVWLSPKRNYGISHTQVAANGIDAIMFAVSTLGISQKKVIVNIEQDEEYAAKHDDARAAAAPALASILK